MRDSYVVLPHQRGYGVWGKLSAKGGLYLMHTFTSLVAARSWISDHATSGEAQCP